MKTKFTVKGTHCNSCKMLIEDICNDIKGVKSCKVDFKTGKTEVEHDSDFNLNQLKKEIEEVGEYTVIFKD